MSAKLYNSSLLVSVDPDKPGLKGIAKLGLATAEQLLDIGTDRALFATLEVALTGSTLAVESLEKAFPKSPRKKGKRERALTANGLFSRLVCLSALEAILNVDPDEYEWPESPSQSDSPGDEGEGEPLPKKEGLEIGVSREDFARKQFIVSEVLRSLLPVYASANASRVHLRIALQGASNNIASTPGMLKASQLWHQHRVKTLVAPRIRKLQKVMEDDGIDANIASSVLGRQEAIYAREITSTLGKEEELHQTSHQYRIHIVSQASNGDPAPILGLSIGSEAYSRLWPLVVGWELGALGSDAVSPGVPAALENSFSGSQSSLGRILSSDSEIGGSDYLFGLGKHALAHDFPFILPFVAIATQYRPSGRAADVVNFLSGFSGVEQIIRYIAAERQAFSAMKEGRLK